MSKRQDVADEIERRIRSGEIVARAPSVRAIAEEFGIARATAQQALRLLHDRSVVETRRGAGTFVVDQPPVEDRRIGAVLRIEDDDGFATEWPWPESRSMLANSDFVELCVAQHDELRGRT